MGLEFTVGTGKPPVTRKNAERTSKYAAEMAAFKDLADGAYLKFAVADAKAATKLSNALREAVKAADMKCSILKDATAVYLVKGEAQAS